jgi:branched-chain amino acid transport system ATP-binding protein
MEPELMLLDEPTQGMGHEDVGKVTALIKRAAADRTVLMVEHNMSVVATIADTITVMQRGRIIADGTYAEVSKQSAWSSRPTWDQGRKSSCRVRTRDG